MPLAPLRREVCPRWRFVNADLPTIEYGSPFAELEKP